MHLLFYSIAYLFILNTVSVDSYCLRLECRGRTRTLTTRCRLIHDESRITGIRDEDCCGSNKIFITDEIVNHTVPYSMQCHDGYVFNGDMQCTREGWQPGCGPWETRQYHDVPGRTLELEMKVSEQSIRYRKLRLF